MILLDWSGTFFAALHVDLRESEEPNFEYIRHLALNTLRSYNKKFKHQYGQMFVCFDSKSWREKRFKYYKWCRKHNKSDDGYNWDEIMQYAYKIQQEITDNLPFRTLQINQAEGDDIIGVISAQAIEPTLIISNDKDLVSCTSNKMVKMFRPYIHDFFVVEDPKRFEFELIVSGDKIDGIPNIKSCDDFYVTQFKDKENGIKPKRAKSISQKFKNELWNDYIEGTLQDKLISLDLLDSYSRNWKLIGINNQPTEIKKRIISIFNDKSKLNNIFKTINYLQQNKMFLLVKNISDFEPIYKTREIW